jgi:hypothetical protein
MNGFLSTCKKDSTFRRLALWTIALVTFTSIHHVYGGAVYATSWRIIMPIFFFIPMLVLTLTLQYQASIRMSRILLLAYVLLCITIWVIGVGVFEGGYNHLLKNVLYYSSASKELMVKMFPPEFGGAKFYETAPNDFLFESTGIATTIFAFLVVGYLIPFVKLQWNRIQSSQYLR